MVRVAALRAALRRFQRHSELLATASGLTPQRYMLLLMIKGAPDRSQRSTVSDLVEQLQLAQSTVTELVERSERAGLIKRESSSRDGRIVYLTLTSNGEQLLARSFRDHETERRELRRTLRNIDPS